MQVFDRDKVERSFQPPVQCGKIPPQGHDHLSLSEDDDTFIIAVKDTGMRIEPEHLASIFERFRGGVRLHQALRGDGLGLSSPKRWWRCTREDLGGKHAWGGKLFSFTISKTFAASEGRESAGVWQRTAKQPGADDCD